VPAVADPLTSRPPDLVPRRDLPGETTPSKRPADYHRLKTLQLVLARSKLDAERLVTHLPRERPLFVGDTDEASLYDLWHARRIAWRKHFRAGAYASDITLANWPQMDYWEKPVVGVAPADAASALHEARQFSLAFFYWMQTDAPRHDGGHGYRGLRLRGDVLGTTDGLAKQAYYREGRRIRAEFTVLEQHIGVNARPGRQAAEDFFDSVGIGAYRIDLHPSTRGATPHIYSYPFDPKASAARSREPAARLQNIGTTCHQRRLS
jgi:hypothetical protein